MHKFVAGSAPELRDHRSNAAAALADVAGRLPQGC